MTKQNKYIRWLQDLKSQDTGDVGGKNASLGEMLSGLKDEGVKVPEGFATTSLAYRDFLEKNELNDTIAGLLNDWTQQKTSLKKTGKSIRGLFLRSSFSEEAQEAIRQAYRQLCEQYGIEDLSVATRSSATAEDLPDASFAGQQETFLNISGEDDVLDACKKCYASLFTDRAIAYRQEKEFDHLKVALSIGVQKMVRSDLAGSGVMFTLDPENGFRDVVVINAGWGLGENIVQGTVTPDEYRVFKPLLSKEGARPIIQRTIGEKEKKMVYTTGGTSTTKNVETSTHERVSTVLDEDEMLLLGIWGASIEKHYGRPMDIEWAKDGQTGEMFIVQARPETVQSQKATGVMKSYSLKEKGKVLVGGLAIGEAIASGKAMVIQDINDIDTFEDDAILVTGMTDPDWVPVMKRAAGIITDHGGRTSHAAIVSRELNVPAIVGTGNATQELKGGRQVTLSCAEGQRGHAYDGELEYEVKDISFADLPETRTHIMVNMASPAGALRWWQLPCNGIGLARMEFIINNSIQIHPMALANFNSVEDRRARKQIEELTRGYDDKSQFFVDHLAEGIASISAVQYPNPVIVRMSDFKTNEYASLIGGSAFEPHESNPMIGFRGTARYYSDRYRSGFGLECRAIRKVREEIGMNNVVIMLPFCRTLDEADRALAVLADEGLERGRNGLHVYVMAEIPSNVILAEEFAERFDGFSIGSNDLTQLVLGIDRDSDELSPLFDERDEAVKRAIADLISKAHAKKRKVGICGQAPSDHPHFAEFLVKSGIDSISLNPDRVVETIEKVAEMEKK
ncbi:MAG: phosphoenolpyruvate synthase [Chitinivibrionales bacterium]|nr:phosphoenolpyruvate synthase [Chitinivibrionales bacterium]